MSDVIQIVPALVGMLVAIILIIALFQLFAIRKSLERLVNQRQTPFQQARSDAEDQFLPASRGAMVSPPTAPPPIQQARFEEVAQQTPPVSRLAVAGPPPPPVPVQQMRREEVSGQLPLGEEAAEPTLRSKESSGEALPTYSTPTASPQPSAPTQPKVNRLPLLIGIVVMVFAVGFLIFMILHSK